MCSGSANLFLDELYQSAFPEVVKPRIKLFAIECPSYVQVIGLVATGVIGGGGTAICVAAAVTSFGVPLISTSIGIPLIAIWGTISGGGFISFIVFLCFRKVEPQARVLRETIVQDEPKKKDPVVIKKEDACKETEDKSSTSSSRKKKNITKSRRSEKDKRKEETERLKRARIRKEETERLKRARIRKEETERLKRAQIRKEETERLKRARIRKEELAVKKNKHPVKDEEPKPSDGLPPKDETKKILYSPVRIHFNKWYLDMKAGIEFEPDYTPATRMLPSLPQIGIHGGSYPMASHPMVLKLSYRSLNSFPDAKNLIKMKQANRWTKIEVYLIVYDASQLKGACLNYIIHPWLFAGLTLNTVEAIEERQAVEQLKKKKELAHSKVGINQIAEIGLFGADGISEASGNRGLAVGKLKKQNVQVHTAGEGTAISPNNAKFIIDRTQTVSSFYSIASTYIDKRNPTAGKKVVATFSVLVNSTTEAGDGRKLMEALRDGINLEDILDKLKGKISQRLYDRIYGMIKPPDCPNEG